MIVVEEKPREEKEAILCSFVLVANSKPTRARF